MAGAGGLTPAAAPSRTAPRRRQLLGCLAAVALVHLALLGDWHRPTPASRTSAAASSGRATPQAAHPRIVVMRLRQLPPREAGETSAPAPPVPATPPLATPTEPAAPVEQAETPPQVAPRESTTPGSGEEIDPSLYLPRSALTEGASPLDMVDLPYPDQAPSGDFRAELTLFIDQDGSVRRVRIEEGALPAALADAARQAFLRARFAPGSIDGVAVRTRMRIEIEFSATPRPDAPHGAP